MTYLCINVADMMKMPSLVRDILLRDLILKYKDNQTYLDKTGVDTLYIFIPSDMIKLGNLTNQESFDFLYDLLRKKNIRVKIRKREPKRIQKDR